MPPLGCDVEYRSVGDREMTECKGNFEVVITVISVRWRWYQKVPCLEGFTVRSASIPTRLRPAAATAAASLLASI